MQSKEVQEIINAAKLIEKKYNVQTSVIKTIHSSPMPWAGSGEATIFVIAKEADQHQIIQQIRNDRQFSGISTREMFPVNEMLSMMRKYPQTIRNNVGGLGFIPPFFFHKEVYGNYGKQLKIELNAHFGPEINKEIQERLERINTFTKKDAGKRASVAKEEVESKTKVIGKREQSKVFKALKTMAEQIQNEKIDSIIVMDRAGRPLGEPLRRIVAQVYGKKLGVFYVYPGPVSRNHSEIKNENYTTAAQLLEKELPKLVRAVRGKRIMLVDDVIYSNTTFERMQQLLKRFKPKRLIQGFVKTHNGSDVSWSQQEINNLQTSRDSFLATRRRIGRGKARKLRGLRQHIGILEGKVIAKLRRR